MNISVIGAGYVGLTTAACLAEIGHTVYCADNDEQKLNLLKTGGIPFYEPYLESIVHRNRQTRKLSFVAPEEATAAAKVIFICVGTPPLDNGDADLSNVATVAKTITQYATGDCLVVEKSTVPVQTGQQLKRQLQLYAGKHLRCEVASNPEFLREGSAIDDFFHPDRIVIGIDKPSIEGIFAEMYRPILEQSVRCPVHGGQCNVRMKPRWIVSDTNSAELIKHASNSFLAMKISFINIVSDLCEKVDADVSTVSEGIGLDRRIGKEFLKPGIGFGGFCFPKDLQAFIRIAAKSGCDFALLKEVQRINQNRAERLLDKLRRELWIMRGKKVAVWGLSFKPNTDDVRFAPSISIIQKLREEGAIVTAYDPKAAESARRICPSINFCNTPYEAAEGAHAVILVTEWEEFRRTDWHKLKDTMEHPLIVDGRNLLDPFDLAAFGFQYVSMGRRTLLPTQTVRDVAFQNPSYSV
jgi:UDPglucose 6-dehydrogenase